MREINPASARHKVTGSALRTPEERSGVHVACRPARPQTHFAYSHFSKRNSRGKTLLSAHVGKNY
jgi:hypothetical protein